MAKRGQRKPRRTRRVRGRISYAEFGVAFEIGVEVGEIGARRRIRDAVEAVTFANDVEEWLRTATGGAS